MTCSFDPNFRLIAVEAFIEGPTGNARLQFALDTGSNRTIVNRQILESLGYDPDASRTGFQYSGVGGSGSAPGVVLTSLRALGHEQRDFLVVCHSVATKTRLDGLLGLDFLRGHVLTIDFPNHQIDLI